MTFDGWDARYYGDCLTYGQDSLMHFRTKGSKNGIRRYQNPDGTWTELGLKERRIREGFGERLAARREARKARRIEKKAARAAIRSANWERAMKYKAEQAEQKRLRNPKRMTNDELKNGIERLKMEQEYRELSKSPLLKTGEKFVENYFKYKAAKEEAAEKKEERRFQYAKLNAERANTRTRAKADIKKAEADKARAKADLAEVNKGHKGAANKAKLIGAKLAYRNTTIRGGIGKFINKSLGSIADSGDAIRKGRAEVDSMISGRKAIDKYNKGSFRLFGKRKGHRVPYQNTPDQEKAAKRAHELAIEQQKTEQEKWKAKNKGKK